MARVAAVGLLAAVCAGAAGLIAPTRPAPAASCLATSRGAVTLSGEQAAAIDTALADNTTVDATTARFLSSAAIPVRIDRGRGVCFSGGVFVGRWAPATSWRTMHDTYAIVVKDASALEIEGVRVFNYGDALTFDAAGATGWVVRGVYGKYLRDDCMENDFLHSGTIEDTFFDGCYSGISSRPYTATADGSDNIVVVKNSLIRLQAMDAAYSGPVPNHNAFWKWHAAAPRLALFNNVFRADHRSMATPRSGDHMAPPPGKLADCENNVMVWLGSGPFPEALPATFNGKRCFRIVAGAAGLALWNDAAARWHTAHPVASMDVAAPIVSLFTPGVTGSTTLSGTVTLVATAVDDRTVAGVQFALNGDAIGEARAGAEPTKYRLSWDSRSRSDGVYALTAVARDAAGRRTASAAVAVTIRN